MKAIPPPKKSTRSNNNLETRYNHDGPPAAHKLFIIRDINKMATTSDFAVIFIFNLL